MNNSDDIDILEQQSDWTCGVCNHKNTYGSSYCKNRSDHPSEPDVLKKYVDEDYRIIATHVGDLSDAHEISDLVADAIAEIKCERAEHAECCETLAKMDEQLVRAAKQLRAITDATPIVWVDQAGPHDCFTACIASLTGLPHRDFPDPPDELYSKTEIEYGNAVRKHMLANGWVLLTTRRQIPSGYAVASGPSPRNPDIWHCVVVRDGDLVHDPHPDKTGIEKAAEYEIVVRLVAPKGESEHE